MQRGMVPAWAQSRFGGPRNRENNLEGMTEKDLVATMAGTVEWRWHCGLPG